MTAKRYVAIPETASYKDTATGKVLCPKHEKDYYTVLDRLNRYDEDCKMYRNDALKAEKDKEHLLEENNEIKHYKEAYATEIVKIKQTIKDMMENERTELGQSVLRQLWEAIQ